MSFEALTKQLFVETILIPHIRNHITSSWDAIPKKVRDNLDVDKYKALIGFKYENTNYVLDMEKPELLEETQGFIAHYVANSNKKISPEYNYIFIIRIDRNEFLFVTKILNDDDEEVLQSIMDFEQMAFSVGLAMRKTLEDLN